MASNVCSTHLLPCRLALLPHDYSLADISGRKTQVQGKRQLCTTLWQLYHGNSSFKSFLPRSLQKRCYRKSDVFAYEDFPRALDVTIRLNSSRARSDLIG